MARPGKYLIQKPGSSMWHLRLQYPPEVAAVKGKKKKVWSLGTKNYAEAEELARPVIREHKRILKIFEAARDQNRRRGSMSYRNEQEIGTTVVHPNATKTIATPDSKLIRLTLDDKFLGIEENPVVPHFELELTPSEMREWEQEEAKVARKPDKDPDEELFKLWVTHRSIKPAIEADARRAFNAYKEVVGKPFAKANRLDGQKLAQHFLDQGNSRATAVKKIGHLGALCEVAIHFDRLKNGNPFHAVVPGKTGDGAQQRDILTDAEMAVMRENLDKLPHEEQVLFMLIATTGMRRSEAWDIVSEFEEDGLRCVRVGEKTPQSDRRIPLPPAVLPYLPARITGPLFTRTPASLGKSLIKSMRRLGIKPTQPSTKKDLHSLRHRAKDRLRRAEVGEQYQYAILGHEEKTVAAGYGKGFPMRVLAKHMAHIGY